MKKSISNIILSGERPLYVSRDLFLERVTIDMLSGSVRMWNAGIVILQTLTVPRCGTTARYGFRIVSSMPRKPLGR